MITTNHARYLWSQMARAGYKTREPVELDVDGERPALLHEIIATHREQLDYSIEDLAHLVHLTVGELTEMYLLGDDRNHLQLVR